MHGLIFDFDGVIVETELVEFEAWAQVLAEVGALVEAADFEPLIGTHQPGLFESMVKGWLGPGVDMAQLRGRARELRHPVALAAPILDGVLDLLDEAAAADWAVGLGSSSPRSWIEAHLSHRELLGRFAAVVTRDDVEEVKPAPDIFLEVARRLGVDAGQCVVIEDSAPGCRAAKAAGMACVAVPSAMTKSSDFSPADTVVATLSEVRLSDLEALVATPSG